MALDESKEEASTIQQDMSIMADFFCGGIGVGAPDIRGKALAAASSGPVTSPLSPYSPVGGPSGLCGRSRSTAPPTTSTSSASIATARSC